MFPAVQSGFPAFSAKFEGRVAYMYLDVKGLVTVGLAIWWIRWRWLRLCLFVSRTGLELARRDRPPRRIKLPQEWQTLKNDPSLATKGCTKRATPSPSWS